MVKVNNQLEDCLIARQVFDEHENIKSWELFSIGNHTDRLVVFWELNGIGKRVVLINTYVTDTFFHGNEIGRAHV